MIQLKKKRILENSKLILLEKIQNSKKTKKLNIYKLNLEDYRKKYEIELLDKKKLEPINNFNNKLAFKSIFEKQFLIKTDNILAEKRKQWHTELTKDINIDEVLNVLIDMKQKSDAELEK